MRLVQASTLETATSSPAQPLSAVCPMASTVAFTSINPFGRTELQLTCFAAWKRLGVQVRTLNSASEKSKLLELGLGEEDILEIDVSETGAMFFGKPVPSITALFERADREFSDHQLVIVNSDIYPAARNADFIDAYLEMAPALALTREEVGALDRPPARPNHPYRGGLDTFLFKPWSVKLMAERLAVWGSSERMAFGVPGWDFVVGSQIIDPSIGGRIMDGPMLLHVSHPQTYSDINEFGHFIAAMKALGAVTSDTVAEAAEEFAQKIRRFCADQVPESRRVWATYYKPPRPGVLPSDRAMEVARETLETVAWARWIYPMAELARFADERLSAPRPSLDAACSFFCRHPHHPFQFSEILLAFLFEFQCARGHERAITARYPMGNKHGEALKMIQKSQASNPDRMRVMLTRLFCEELLYFGIFNVRLCDWLALSCENEDERALMSKVQAIWGNTYAGAA